MLQAKSSRVDPKARSFTYTMSNVRGKYHKFPFRRYLKDNFTLSFKMPIIKNKIEENDMEVDRKVVFKYRDLPADF